MGKESSKRSKTIDCLLFWTMEIYRKGWFCTTFFLILIVPMQTREKWQAVLLYNNSQQDGWMDGYAQVPKNSNRIANNTKGLFCRVEVIQFSLDKISKLNFLDGVDALPVHAVCEGMDKQWPEQRGFSRGKKKRQVYCRSNSHSILSLLHTNSLFSSTSHHAHYYAIHLQQTSSQETSST